MAGKLKPLDAEREEKPGKYPDGDGLYLIVAGSTSKNWTYRYWFKGKERWHGLGSFKDVSLKQARLLRDAARLQVRAGVDLVQEKRNARQAAKATEAAENAKTFEECAQAYIHELERKTPRTVALLAQALRLGVRLGFAHQPFARIDADLRAFGSFLVELRPELGFEPVSVPSSAMSISSSAQ